MRAAAIVAALQARRLARRGWLAALALAGLPAAAAIGALAARDAGADRLDALRADGASLLLLGGLAAALALGAGALNRDADAGHLGLLSAGAGRDAVTAGVLAARLAALLGVLALWGLALEAAGAALGLGLDGPLAVHALAVAVGLALTLLAAAAASTVVGPGPAAAFGAAVYVLAQAAVNLKAAADQGVIGTAADAVRALYYVGPRTITSPMIAELQARDAAGPAAPRVEINQNVVIVPAAGWGSVAWTLAWCLLLGALCAVGLRRRPLA